jgi:hypothetical protein
MSTQNPYQPPGTSEYANPQSGEGGAVPEEAVEALRETRPWVTLLAVLGFIGAGFVVLAGLSILAFGNSFNNGLPPAFGLVYILMAGLYVLPSVLLMRYSSSIGRLLAGAGSNGLVDALRSQRAFWRAVGIMTLVFIVIGILATVGGIAAILGSVRR